jgi:hypothetical protein
LGDHPKAPQASFELALGDVVIWGECEREPVRNMSSYDDR